MKTFENWTATYEQLTKSNQQDELEPKDLEKLALAAYLTGRDVECYHLLEQSHRGYLDRGMTEKAIGCTFWLGIMLMNAGERARGSGWISKGERLLGKIKNQDCPEKALLLIPRALRELSAGNGAEAQQLFEQAAAAGEQFQHDELKVLGRLGLGQALIEQGQISEGIKLLDETMVILETEAVFPLVHGIVYCAAIETCRKVWDLERAQEWTSALTRWCDAQPDIVPFRGACMVQRAEIFQFHGEWSKALRESRNAIELLAHHPEGSAAGDAYYRQAEILRLEGNVKKAEDCYTEASRRGRKPQPGLALLRLAQGLHEAAETAVRNTLQETKDPNMRAELLPAVVCIMIALKQNKEGQGAAKELCNIARELNVPYLLAMCAHCKGAVLHAEGNLRPALEQLQKALKFWVSLNLPYESACTRELTGRVYLAMNDKDNAETELMAAKWIFEQLKARPDLERVNRLFSKKGNPNAHGLSLRELQVLRLVASGKTNKSIANKLFISERTVDRHVSNIFNKLGVSSRVEATAFTLTNQMLDDNL